jgi:hypothetical protein
MVRWCTMHTARSIHGPVRVFYWAIINNPYFDERVVCTVLVYFEHSNSKIRKENCDSSKSFSFPPKPSGVYKSEKMAVSHRKKLFTRINENLGTVFDVWKLISPLRDGISHSPLKCTIFFLLWIIQITDFIHVTRKNIVLISKYLHFATTINSDSSELWHLQNYRSNNRQRKITQANVRMKNGVLEFSLLKYIKVTACCPLSKILRVWE